MPTFGARLGVSQDTISLDTKNSQLAKIHTDLGAGWNEKGIAELATKPRACSVASDVPALWPARPEGTG